MFLCELRWDSLVEVIGVLLASITRGELRLAIEGEISFLKEFVHIEKSLRNRVD